MRYTLQGIILLAVIFIFSDATFSQVTKDEFVSFRRIKILTADSEEIIGSYGIIRNDSLEYFEDGFFESKMLNLSQIQDISESKGNYARTGTWVGGIAGIVAGTLITISTIEESTQRSGRITTTEIKVQTWPIYVFSGIGSLLGYVIGAATDDWQSVFSEGKITDDTAMRMNFETGCEGFKFNCKIFF